MEHGGKGTQGIGAWSLDLAHHIDHDGTRLTHTDLQTAGGIATAQGATDLALGTCHRESCHMDGTIAWHRDIAIGRDREILGLLGGTIDIDDHLIAWTQDIVLRRGNVHIGLEREELVVEDVTTKDLQRVWAGLALIHLVDVLLDLCILEVGLLVELSGCSLLTSRQLLFLRIVLTQSGICRRDSTIGLALQATLL